MTTPRPDVTAALASLEARWGAAAPRRLGAVVGSLATVPLPEPPPAAPRRPGDERIVPTGFAALDAILGPGGLPRDAGVAVHGDGTSGKTTVALRLAAAAQTAGSIVAYVDLSRSLDPVEAAARGVRLEWLVVLAPDSIDDGLAMAGALVQGRAIDLLLVDLPEGVVTGRIAPSPRDGRRPPTVAERLHRLAALSRRAGTTLVVLEPPGLPSGLHRALDGSTSLRLELARRAWIRLGRDVVGQRTEVVVARNRFGPPGRRAELRILYAEGGDRDACLRRDELLGPTAGTSLPGPIPRSAARGPVAEPATRPPGHHPVIHPPDTPRTADHAPPPPLLAPSPAPAGAGAPRLRLVPDRARRPRRTPMG